VSYDEKEIGAYTGNPVELYKFENSNDPPDEWWYASGDDTVLLYSDTYVPMMISRSQLRLATDIRGDSLTVRVARDNPVALLWLNYPPQDSIWLTIYRKHRDDAETLVVWKGRVRGVSWSGAEAVLECEPLVGLLKRPCLRATFQLVCNHQLYDDRCGYGWEGGMINGQDSNGVYFKNPVDHPGPATITDIVGNKYYSAAFSAYAIEFDPPADYLYFFTAGYAVDLVTGERRFIKFHDGGVGDGYIELYQPFSGVEIDDEIDVYAGCNHIANSATAGIEENTCKFKFNNVVNFGGFPAMPVVNPFTRGI